ncbi:MAG: hydrogenase iron-sulfur subunit, partial [Thermodesulfobacteriota bacterium]
AEDALKAKIKTFSLELANDTGILVFLCKKSVDIKDEINEDGSLKGYAFARVVELPCIGMLQPSMIDIAIESGAGVLAVGCKQGDCSFRTGNSWFNKRLLMTRPPVVRRGINRARISALWLSAGETRGFFDGLDKFARGLAKGVKDG